MRRGKVSVEYIQNDQKRSTAYEKRKKGLVKKAYELATLCDVPLCMVIYPAGPNSAPVTYPEKEEEVGAVIKRYVSGSREENAKRRLNLEQGLALVNKKKKNSNSDPPLPRPQPQQVYPTWHPAMDGLNRDDLLNMASLLNCKLRQVKERMKIRPTSSLNYNNNTNAPVNGGDYPMCKASSSAYDPNSYLPENNALPGPYPLTAFYNHPPPLGPGLRSWTSTTKIFAAMEVSDAKTQDNKENIVPTTTTPLLSSPPSDIFSKKKNTAARWGRMRVPFRDITNLSNSIEAQSSSSFLPTYQSVDLVASDLNPKKRKASDDDLKHLHISRSLRMGFR